MWRVARRRHLASPRVLAILENPYLYPSTPPPRPCDGGRVSAANWIVNCLYLQIEVPLDVLCRFEGDRDTEHVHGMAAHA